MNLEKLLQDLDIVSFQEALDPVQKFIDSSEAVDFDGLKNIVKKLRSASGNAEDEAGCIDLAEICIKFIEKNNSKLSLPNFIQMIRWFDGEVYPYKDAVQHDLISLKLAFCKNFSTKSDIIYGVAQEQLFDENFLIRLALDAVKEQGLRQQDVVDFANRMKEFGQDKMYILTELLRNSATIIDEDSKREWLDGLDREDFKLMNRAITVLPHNRFISGDFYVKEIWQKSVASFAIKSGFDRSKSNNADFPAVNILSFLAKTKEPLKLSWFIENVLNFISAENFGLQYREVRVEHANEFFQNPASDFGAKGLHEILKLYREDNAAIANTLAAVAINKVGTDADFTFAKIDGILDDLFPDKKMKAVVVNGIADNIYKRQGDSKPYNDLLQGLIESCAAPTSREKLLQKFCKDPNLTVANAESHSLADEKQHEPEL